MKPLNSGQSVWGSLRLAVACGLVASGAGGLCALAQTNTPEKAGSISASTQVGVSTVNGQAVVTLNGKQVYSEPAKGLVSSRSSNVNGVEYSVVYDGDKVVWENVLGAAQQLGSAAGGATGFSAADSQQFSEQQRKAMERIQAERRRSMEIYRMSNHMQGGTNSFSQSRGSSWSSGSSAAGGSGFGNGGGQNSSQSSSAAIGTKTVNGTTVVTYEGREIPVGATKGRVSAKSRVVGGKQYAAAFDDDRVIWENVPGAADQLK